MSDPIEKAIFLNALEQDQPAVRDAYLAIACAGNAVLRNSIEELLRAHNLADNPLDQTPAGVAVPAARISGGISRPMDDPSPAECAGTVLGNYRLMEQIGEGGFGVVFVAEQQQPVRRKVALKLIKPGMHSRDVIARFEAERQALALMDHPNIARVFDAGATASGRPYFVMELVRGISITEYCDRQKVAPRERLELFLHLCEAVQHAHQKGVIHRDLKPSNVLVTLHDSTPVVKAIDFGIAKAVGQSLTDKTIYTRFAQLMGTPLYMSPEQAELSGLDVDTRSDIYSLGVLLYELIVGATPHDQERLQTASFHEIRRIICEEEPHRPSARLTTLGNAIATIAVNRRLEPRRLSAFVKGDLDWIIMKALEKDRTRRYETASEFAADLRRFLNNEPIEARPPSAGYRFRKFARRHKAVLTTTSLVVVALLLGTTISIWQTMRAIAARTEATQARKEVEEFADRLTEASRLLTSGRTHADAHRWSAAYADYTRATEIQPKYYNVWVERGSLFVRLGLWKLAAADYSKAIELGVPADNPAGWSGAQLFLFTGDTRMYRESCLRMLQYADEVWQGASIEAIRSCVISPTPPADPVKLADRAEKLLSEMADRWPPFPSGEGDGPAPDGGGGNFGARRRPDGAYRPPRALSDRPGGPRFGMGPPGGPRGPGGGPRGVSYYVAGLAHYRAGAWSLAVQRLRESQTVDPLWAEFAGGTHLPALAMALYRMGQTAEAQTTLKAAHEAIDSWTERMIRAPVGTMSVPWFDWIECLLLYREATELITGSPPADDPRFQTLEDRALAALRNGN